MQRALILKLILSLSAQHGVDPALVAAFVEVESQFNPAATGQLGEQGLMQLRPEYFGANGANLYDPQTNLEVGIEHLKELLARCQSPDRLDFFVALCHNRGVTGAFRVESPQTDSYLLKVKKAYSAYARQFQRARITAQREKQTRPASPKPRPVYVYAQ